MIGPLVLARLARDSETPGLKFRKRCPPGGPGPSGLPFTVTVPTANAPMRGAGRSPGNPSLRVMAPNRGALPEAASVGTMLRLRPTLAQLPVALAVSASHCRSVTSESPDNEVFACEKFERPCSRRHSGYPEPILSEGCGAGLEPSPPGNKGTVTNTEPQRP